MTLLTVDFQTTIFCVSSRSDELSLNHFEGYFAANYFKNIDE